MSQFMIDIHCHPDLKPYGKSFNNKPAGTNTADRDQANSIWHYHPPTLADRALQLFTGISKFRQSDFTTLVYGNVRLVCASLYPIEQGFFNNELGDGAASDLANQFITGVGENRVNYIQANNNYFEDLCKAYDYYRQLDGAEVQTEAGKCKYMLVSNYTQIENYIALHPDAENVLFVVMTIEGLHVLHSDISKPDETAIMANLQSIKNWQHAPFFVTFAHHFYNHFCGHARSLTGIVGNTCDQSLGLNSGFTPLGERVLHEVLSNKNGRRIHIDIKHMSALSRKRYFEILATDYANESIPVIVSHGAANGLRSMDEQVVDGKNTAYKLLAEDINLYDNEILMVAKTGGIFGFQLDERRIASESTLKNTKHSLLMDNIRHYRAELLWNQVQHVVELLDRHDLFAWDCMAIGSDYDGIINPLNGYLTEEVMDDLQQYLGRYAFNYMKSDAQSLRGYNQLPASEIVNRIFYLNAKSFMKKWFV
jgi:microsomal dipeptidase-like Zn-dependent dipeptidase